MNEVMRRLISCVLLLLILVDTSLGFTTANLLTQKASKPTARLQLPISSTKTSSNDDSIRNDDKSSYSIAIVGGGPSGIFSAITIATKLEEDGRWNSEKTDGDCTYNDISISIFEASDTLLRSLKMKKSSTGLPNNLTILQDPTKKIRELLMEGYPRGRKEITSILTKHYSPTTQQEWFENISNSDGDSILTNRDGSVISKNPQVILDSLEGHQVFERHKDRIHMYKNTKVVDIQHTRSSNEKALRDSNDNGDSTFSVSTAPTDIHGVEMTKEFDCAIIATGDSFYGYQLVQQSLNHTIIPPIRSMFGLKVMKPIKTEDDDDCYTNSNEIPTVVTAPYCRVSFKMKIPGRKRSRTYKEIGLVRIGMTSTESDHSNEYALSFIYGDAIGKLTSFAAEELRTAEYKGTIYIHFCPEIGVIEDVYDKLWTYRQSNPKVSLIKDGCPLEYREIDYDKYDFETDAFAIYVDPCVPAELWSNICHKACGPITDKTKWGNLSPKKVRLLADYLVGYPVEFDGRCTEKIYESWDEELFVNAGGVDLRELDMSTLESKMYPGLYFCGHILNVDGSTIGYNRMLDWSTGSTAGTNCIRPE